MEIQKKFIVPILLMLQSFDQKTGASISGLLNEEMGLGVKRKLHKIRKELLTHQAELQEDAKEIDAIEDEEKKKEEADKLMSETVKLTAEPAMLSEIEKISSKTPYDFDLIEMIAQ